MGSGDRTDSAAPSAPGRERETSDAFEVSALSALGHGGVNTAMSAQTERQTGPRVGEGQDGRCRLDVRRIGLPPAYPRAKPEEVTGLDPCDWQRKKMDPLLGPRMTRRQGEGEEDGRKNGTRTARAQEQRRHCDVCKSIQSRRLHRQPNMKDAAAAKHEGNESRPPGRRPGDVYKAVTRRRRWQRKAATLSKSHKPRYSGGR